MIKQLSKRGDQYFLGVIFSIGHHTQNLHSPRTGTDKQNSSGQLACVCLSVSHLTIGKSIDFVFKPYKGTVIGITQPPPTEGAWSALFSNLSKSGLDNYVAKRSKRPLLEEVA